MILFCVGWCGLVRFSSATIPSVEFRLNEEGKGGYAAPAAFGASLLSVQSKWLPLAIPKTWKDGCSNVRVKDGVKSPFVLLVERGNCSFASKTLAAQRIGAVSLIVANTLQGIYGNWSQAENRLDYECANGEGWVKEVSNQPPWSPLNSPPECAMDSPCRSRQCLVTNITDVSLGTKVCCAWDVLMTMSEDPAVDTPPIVISSVFIGLEQGSSLFQNPALEAGMLKVKLNYRPQPKFNASTFLLWGLGVVTVGLASYLSARSTGQWMKLGDEPEAQWSATNNENTFVLDVIHAVAFVVLASSFLLLIFYFKLSIAISVLYAFGVIRSMTSLFVLPATRACLRVFDGSPEGPAVTFPVFGRVTLSHALSTLVAAAPVVWWFDVRHTASYAWILQDAFGIVLCIAFLETIQLKSLKVASALLIMAFFYDIFWVFLSPYVFHESVMIAVATGAAFKADPTFCEKYPGDSDCVRSPMPMLLLLPRLNDYRGGFVMLVCWQQPCHTFECPPHILPRMFACLHADTCLFIPSFVTGSWRHCFTRVIDFICLPV